MVNIGKLMTGLQIGAGVPWTLGTVAVTESILNEAIEIMPYALGGIGLIGSRIIIVEFAQLFSFYKLYKRNYIFRNSKYINAK
jgi:hypothetical protein